MEFEEGVSAAGGVNSERLTRVVWCLLLQEIGLALAGVQLDGELTTAYS